jgi:hypothetical protein
MEAAPRTAIRTRDAGSLMLAGALTVHVCELYSCSVAAHPVRSIKPARDFGQPLTDSSPSILIPTYLPHLEYVRRFMSSLTTFAEDASDARLRLVVSESDRDDFQTLADDFGDTLDIHVVTLKTVLEATDGVHIDEDELLQKVGKFNYQSIKKLWGVRFFSDPLTLVMDSEALAVRNHHLSALFDDWKANPIVIYSKHGTSTFQRSVTENCLKILGLPWEDKWMFDYQAWFFEREHVSSLFDHVLKTSGRPLLAHMLELEPIFEFNLYALHVMHSAPTAANFVDAEELLARFLTSDQLHRYHTVMERFDTSAFEYLAWAVESSNVEALSALFANEGLHLFKYDDRHGVPSNTQAQRALIEVTPSVWILPCYVSSSSFELLDTLILGNFEPSAHGTSRINRIFQRMRHWSRP